MLINQQADYTVTPSSLVCSDQLYWSDNFIQSGRRGLEKSRGPWSVKIFEAYCLSWRLTDDTNSVRFVDAGAVSQI